MRFALLLSLAVLSTSASAQRAEPTNPTLQVAGNGKVATMPNIAVIEYSLAGEGKTPDEASTALVEMRKAIVGQVRALLNGNATLTDSSLVLLAVRGLGCRDASAYNAQPRLSEGECAVRGYLATAQGRIRTSKIVKAGTAVGLASRLGARDARIQSFQLEDDKPAKRAALADAVADARRQAAAIATPAGRRLGPIITIRDQNSSSGNIIVSSRSHSSEIAPPAPPPPPPVEINMTPRPIETVARVDVTFALLP